MPDYVYIIIACVAAVVAVAAIVIIFLCVKKKREPKIIVDETFVNNLVEYLGDIKNVKEVNVDNGRLKIEVNDLDLVKLDEIKSLALNGIFVTGNVIKILFKYDSETIKKAINSRL
ncbi:MAG: hypothetical protein IJU60_01620 [Acholeplasmatales bacterium]|nr:hypothetical protein [Acholeplasmatales bacterium]